MLAIRTQGIPALKLIAVASRCHINIAISSPGILPLHLVKYIIGLLLMPDTPLFEAGRSLPIPSEFPNNRAHPWERIICPRGDRRLWPVTYSPRSVYSRSLNVSIPYLELLCVPSCIRHLRLRSEGNQDWCSILLFCNMKLFIKHLIEAGV